MQEPGTEISRTQEVGVWWGGYSPWTMLPSLLVCLMLTGVIAWWSWNFLEREDVKLAVFSLGGIVWVSQTLRFGHRFFGHNYMVTTRRLVHDWGILYKKMRTMLLSEVASVEVKRTALEDLLRVSRVIFKSCNPAQQPMVWTGVRQAQQVVERVRLLLAKARVDS